MHNGSMRVHGAGVKEGDERERRKRVSFLSLIVFFFPSMRGCTDKRGWHE